MTVKLVGGPLDGLELDALEFDNLDGTETLVISGNAYACGTDGKYYYQGKQE